MGIGTYYFLATIDLRPATSKSITHRNISPYTYNILYRLLLPTFPHISCPVYHRNRSRTYISNCSSSSHRRVFSSCSRYELLYSSSPRSTTITINCELYVWKKKSAYVVKAVSLLFCRRRNFVCAGLVIHRSYFISSPSPPPAPTFQRPKSVRTTIYTLTYTHSHTESRPSERAGRSKSETHVILYYGEISAETDHPDSIYICTYTIGQFPTSP